MKRLFSFNRPALAVLGLSLAVVFSACNKFDNDDLPDQPVSGLMVFNLAPSKSVSVALNGNLLTNFPLSYTSFTGGYLNVYPGNRSLESYDYSTGDSLAKTSFTFEQNKYYSGFVVGSGENVEHVIAEDNYDSLSASNGQAYVRYINAITDASVPSVTISSNGTNVVNDNAAYKTVSVFNSIAPGEIAIGVTNGGNITATRTITVEAKKAYTILLIGNPASAAPADNVQIKFIENGTLSDDNAQQRTSSAQARAFN